MYTNNERRLKDSWESLKSTVIVHSGDLPGFSRTQREDPKGKGMIKLEGGLAAACSCNMEGSVQGIQGALLHCTPSVTHTQEGPCLRLSEGFLSLCKGCCDREGREVLAGVGSGVGVSPVDSSEPW